MDFKPIPFIGGPRHGETWAPKSKIARKKFVRLTSAKGESYVRKAYRAPDGQILEVWVFADIESAWDGFAGDLGVELTLAT